MYSLHREALKQSATDPSSGKIDISILTTGMSNTARQRRVEIGQRLRKLLQSKAATSKTFSYSKIFEELKTNSDIVSVFPFYSLKLSRVFILRVNDVSFFDLL